MRCVNAIISRLLGLTVAAALTGCAVADFTPYQGAQQNWPTARGAFVSTQYAVPAYHGYPARPYIVLGYLDATTARFVSAESSNSPLVGQRKSVVTRLL